MTKVTVLPIRLKKYIFWFFSIQLIMVGLYGLARRFDTYDIGIEVGEMMVRAYVDGRVLLETPRPNIAGGGVALSLMAPVSLEWWTHEGTLTQGWEEIRVTDLKTGDTLLMDDFENGSLGQWRIDVGSPVVSGGLVTAPRILRMSAGTTEWRTYRVDARLRRGRDASVRVLVHHQDHVEFIFNPFYHGVAVLRTQIHAAATANKRGMSDPASYKRFAVLAEKLLVSWFLGSGVFTSGVLLCLALLIPLRPLEGYLNGQRARRAAAITAGALPWLTAGLTLIICMLIIVKLLHGIPHVQDSVAYLFQAKIFATGRVWAPAPPIPEFFQHQYIIIDQQRMFSQYPFGFPLLLAGGVLVGAPWLIPPLLGALNILLLWRLGTALYNRGTAITTVLLAAGSPFFLLMHGSFMSHSAGLFYCLIALHCLLPSSRSHPWLRGIAGGAGLGLLGATRPLSALAIGLICATALLVDLAKQKRAALPRMCGAAIGMAAVMGIFLAYNHAITGHPFSTGYDSYMGRSIVDEKLGFSGKHSLSRGLNNTDSQLTYLMAALFRWPAFLVLAPLMITLLRPDRQKADAWLAGGFLVYMGAYCLYLRAGICYGPRFYFEALPFILLLSARGIVAPAVTAAWLRKHHEQPRPGAAWLLQGVIVLFVMAAAVWNPRGYLKDIDRLRALNDLSPAILQQVAEQHLDNALVFIKPMSAGMWVNYGSVFPQNTPDMDGPVVYARSLGSVPDRRLMDIYPGRNCYIADYPHGNLRRYNAPPGPRVLRWEPPESSVRECDRQLIWESEPPVRNGAAVLAVGAALSRGPGEVNLYVNHEYAVTITPAEVVPYTWRHRDFSVVFKPITNRVIRKIGRGYLFGIMFIHIPACHGRAGLPVHLRLAPVRQESPGPFLALYEFQDAMRQALKTGLLTDEERLGQMPLEGFADMVRSDWDRLRRVDFRTNSRDLVRSWWFLDCNK
ncbi:hypothetical protein JW905_18620 [bacterium]|nr:hypothetical protein [candidate division CSSED10-310 bacterium]